MVLVLLAGVDAKKSIWSYVPEHFPAQDNYEMGIG